MGPTSVASGPVLSVCARGQGKRISSQSACVLTKRALPLPPRRKRQVMHIDPKWLVELAPRFFKPADAHRLSRRKRWERIEPLYDKYNDPVAWRLSKRKG